MTRPNKARTGKYVWHKEAKGRKFELLPDPYNPDGSNTIWYTVDGFILPRINYVLCPAPEVWVKVPVDAVGLVNICVSYNTQHMTCFVVEVHCSGEYRLRALDDGSLVLERKEE